MTESTCAQLNYAPLNERTLATNDYGIATASDQLKLPDLTSIECVWSHLVSALSTHPDKQAHSWTSLGTYLY